MKKLKLAAKYILFNIFKLMNDIMIFITGNKLNWFKKNKIKIASAIIGILAIVNMSIGTNAKAYIRDNPNIMCYDTGISFQQEQSKGFIDGFWDTIKAIFFLAN